MAVSWPRKAHPALKLHPVTRAATAESGIAGQCFRRTHSDLPESGANAAKHCRPVPTLPDGSHAQGGASLAPQRAATLRATPALKKEIAQRLHTETAATERAALFHQWLLAVHPPLKASGTGRAAPDWLCGGRQLQRRRINSSPSAAAPSRRQRGRGPPQQKSAAHRPQNGRRPLPPQPDGGRHGPPGERRKRSSKSITPNAAAPSRRLRGRGPPQQKQVAHLRPTQTAADGRVVQARASVRRQRWQVFHLSRSPSKATELSGAPGATPST